MTSHYVTMPFLAGRSMGHSRIVDPYSRSRADTSHRPGVAVADVDLDELYEYWIGEPYNKRYPTLREAFPGRRRPETCGATTRPDSQNRWKVAAPPLHGSDGA